MMLPTERYGPREHDFLERHEDFLIKVDIIALLGLVALAAIMIF